MAPEVAEAEVDVFPARTWAEIHKGLGRAVDSPEDGIECWRYPDPDGSYDCAVEYGNGWLLTAAAKPGLTGDREDQDLNALTAIVKSIKENNAFDRAVQTHANM